MFEAYKDFFKKYVQMEGRSCRSDYWYAVLINFVISTLLSIVFKNWKTGLELFSSLFSLAVLIPGLCIAVRRLHDIGKGGQYLFWLLLPIAGWIMVIVQLCKAGTEGENQYGMPEPPAAVRAKEQQ